MTAPLSDLVTQLAHRQIMVVGDVILDEYLIGTATRLSREAPIPVLEFEERRLIPGGAANPAANVAALGSHALQVAVVGADSAAEQLRGLLQARGINTAGLCIDPDRPTTIKMRIMAHMGLRFPQQVARIDTLSREPIDAGIAAQLLARVRTAVGTADALLVSDYHAGLLTDSFVRALHGLARDAGLRLLAADAQGSLERYTGFDVVKCNADEAQAYLRRSLRTEDEFALAAVDLCQQLALGRGMFITRGAAGMTLGYPDGSAEHCPAPFITDVYDTVGAGDTAIAVLTLALTAGASPLDAAQLANYASGLVVRRVGNYAPTRDELLQALITASD